MESDSYEETLKAFYQIDVSDVPRASKYEVYNPLILYRRIQEKHVDFEQYVRENCKNKFKILNRETFHQIKKPIVIFFNHFREKCAYHTNWLDSIYQLASNYGDRIEFIAADMYDIDIIYPGRNPITFFKRFVETKNEKTKIYAIDEKKRIYEHSPYNIAQNIIDLFEYLLNGKLYPSMPLPENNDNKLVKICVYDNYEEVILKSTKNIFLIINMAEMQSCKCEPNYENVALALKDYNLDVVSMEDKENYIPFEYHVNNSPMIYFIPHNDKNNFALYGDIRKENVIIDYLKNIMDNPEFLKSEQQLYKSRMLRKKVEVAMDFQIDFKDLPQFLEHNYRSRFQVFSRSEFARRKDYIFLVFMDFQGKCFKHHVEWLDKLHQVAENNYDNFRQFLIADFKDINCINSKWQPKDMIQSARGKPIIYAKDCLQHTYELGTFDSIAKLYYFTEGIQYRKFFYSESYPNNKLQAVKKYVAIDFQDFLKKAENHIFITFYSSLDEESKNLLDFLETIASDVKDLNIELAKFDVELNYIDLEYAQPIYPAQYFISKNNTNINKLYQGNCLDKEKIFNFIKSNIPVPVKRSNEKHNFSAKLKAKKKRRK